MNKYTIDGKDYREVKKGDFIGPEDLWEINDGGIHFYNKPCQSDIGTIYRGFTPLFRPVKHRQKPAKAKKAKKLLLFGIKEFKTLLRPMFAGYPRHLVEDMIEACVQDRIIKHRERKDRYFHQAILREMKPRRKL